MDSTAHGAHGFFMYYLIHYIIWGIIPSPIFGIFAIFFGTFPDLDGLVFALKGKDPNSNNFQHHMYFWSHWPISYLPVIILFLISWVLNWYPQIFLLPAVGIYTHLLSDSACCGDGMMWTKVPWKKDQFAPFYNFFSRQTDGYHGGYWQVRWRRTWMYKIAQVEGLVIIGYFIWYLIEVGFSFAALICILYFIINMAFGVKTPIAKYLEEPPNGRYDDYRKSPEYLAWMEKNGFIFNSQMHAVKKH